MTARWFALRLAALVVLVGVGVAVAVTVGVPSPTQLQARFAALGPWSGVVFAAVYAAVSLSPLPKTVFTIAAGALFGVPLGLLVVITGATVGALAALYLGRWLGRDAVHRFTGIRTGRFDEQLERRGLWAVLVARLIPVVPFTGFNYLAGLTALRVRDFVLGTVVGMVPATAAYLAVGAYGFQPGSWPFLTAVAALLLLSAAGLVAAGVRRRRERRAAADTPGAVNG